MMTLSSFSMESAPPPTVQRRGAAGKETTALPPPRRVRVHRARLPALAQQVELGGRRDGAQLVDRRPGEVVGERDADQDGQPEEARDDGQTGQPAAVLDVHEEED